MTSLPAVDMVHSFTGYDGVTVITTWHDSATEADEAVLEGLEKGAFFAKSFKGGCLGTFRVACHYK